MEKRPGEMTECEHCTDTDCVCAAFAPSEDEVNVNIEVCELCDWEYDVDAGHCCGAGAGACGRCDVCRADCGLANR